MESKHIIVPSRHTPEMIRAEVDSMLGLSNLRVCLGHVMMLAESKSPYVYGGKVTPQDIGMAMDILNAKETDEAEFHRMLLAELDTSFRATELFEADNNPDEESRKSDVRAFSPEWLCDVLRAACQAVPSITLEQGLWHIPMTMIMHLGASQARAHGMITKRPVDYKEALKLFLEMRNKGGN